MNNDLLFILRSAPYGTTLAREGLEAALAAAALGQKVSVLFMDDGVFQLLKDQQPGHIGQKNSGAMVAALPMYDIEHCFAEHSSLTARHLNPSEIDPGIQVIDTQSVQQVMASHKHIVSF